MAGDTEDRNCSGVSPQWGDAAEHLRGLRRCEHFKVPTALPAPCHLHSTLTEVLHTAHELPSSASTPALLCAIPLGNHSLQVLYQLSHLSVGWVHPALSHHRLCGLRMLLCSPEPSPAPTPLLQGGQDGGWYMAPAPQALSSLKAADWSSVISASPAGHSDIFPAVDTSQGLNVVIDNKAWL